MEKSGKNIQFIINYEMNVSANEVSFMAIR